MKQIYISLLNFNGKENTFNCLESLEKVKRDNFKLTVVAVDNASTDNSLLALSDYRSGNFDFKFIQNKKNLGFAGGQNTAIGYAIANKADYILVLNNDTYVDPNFLNELLKIAESEKVVGVLVPKIYFAPGFEFHKDRYLAAEKGKVLWYAGGEMDWSNVIGHHRGVDEVDKGQYDKNEDTELATGCCMLIKKEVFEKIGLFDDNYFLYYEDSDLSMKAKKAGFEVKYVPRSMIWHKNAGSAGGSGSELQDYYITRNRLLFGFKYAPARSKFALFRESLALLFKGREWQKRGVKDFYQKRLGKGSYRI
jgi:GT2 family glycosyltransferase